MKLLIDIGNSRLKWGRKYNHGSEIISGVPIVYNRQDNIQKQLIGMWSDIDSPKYILISSVVANQYNQQIMQVAQQFWPKAVIIKAESLQRGFGVINAYQQPGKLGVDRWLTLIALRRYFHLPACVVDCGTAITIDVIDEHGLHLGGLIAPGLEMMKQSLSRGAHNLGLVANESFSSLANNTGAAISSGTILAAVGLIEKVMSQQQKGLSLFLTGGDAFVIAEHLRCHAVIELDLVLMGLSILPEHQA